MFVNSSRNARIPFHFNITFPSVSCSLLSADAMDPLGNKQVSPCSILYRRVLETSESGHEGGIFGAQSRKG